MYPAAVSSAFEPNDLAFLKRVFDDVCVERGLADGSTAASNVAAEMIQLYQSGVKDEKSLHLHFGQKSAFG
jgi:hypothetical protein